MAKILPREDLLERRNTAIGSVFLALLEKYVTVPKTIPINLIIGPISEKFLFFEAKGPEPLNIQEAEIYSVNDVFFGVVDPGSGKNNLVRQGIDRLMADIASHMIGTFTFTKYLTGDNVLIATPMDLTAALESLAKKLGIDVETPESLFHKAVKNVRADTAYLQRMTKTVRPRLI